MKFSSFRVDLELDKYLSNVSDLILLMWHNEVLEIEVENEDGEDIKILDPYSLLSKRDLKYLLSIFDRHNSWL